MPFFVVIAVLCIFVPLYGKVSISDKWSIKVQQWLRYWEGFGKFGSIENEILINLGLCSILHSGVSVITQHDSTTDAQSFQYINDKEKIQPVQHLA